MSTYVPIDHLRGMSNLKNPNNLTFEDKDTLGVGSEKLLNWLKSIGITNLKDQQNAVNEIDKFLKEEVRAKSKISVISPIDLDSNNDYLISFNELDPANNDSPINKYAMSVIIVILASAKPENIKNFLMLLEKEPSATQDPFVFVMQEIFTKSIEELKASYKLSLLNGGLKNKIEQLKRNIVQAIDEEFRNVPAKRFNSSGKPDVEIKAGLTERMYIDEKIANLPEPVKVAVDNYRKEYMVFKNNMLYRAADYKVDFTKVTYPVLSLIPEEVRDEYINVKSNYAVKNVYPGKLFDIALFQQFEGVKITDIKADPNDSTKPNGLFVEVSIDKTPWSFFQTYLGINDQFKDVCQIYYDEFLLKKSPDENMSVIEFQIVYYKRDKDGKIDHQNPYTTVISNLEIREMVKSELATQSPHTKSWDEKKAIFNTISKKFYNAIMAKCPKGYEPFIVEEDFSKLKDDGYKIMVSVVGVIEYLWETAKFDKQPADRAKALKILNILGDVFTNAKTVEEILANPEAVRKIADKLVELFKSSKIDSITVAEGKYGCYVNSDYIMQSYETDSFNNEYKTLLGQVKKLEKISDPKEFETTYKNVKKIYDDLAAKALDVIERTVTDGSKVNENEQGAVRRILGDLAMVKELLEKIEFSLNPIDKKIIEDLNAEIDSLKKSTDTKKSELANIEKDFNAIINNLSGYAEKIRQVKEKIYSAIKNKVKVDDSSYVAAKAEYERLKKEFLVDLSKAKELVKKYNDKVIEINNGINNQVETLRKKYLELAQKGKITSLEVKEIYYLLEKIDPTQKIKNGNDLKVSKYDFVFNLNGIGSDNKNIIETINKICDDFINNTKVNASLTFDPSKYNLEDLKPTFEKTDAYLKGVQLWLPNKKGIMDVQPKVKTDIMNPANNNKDINDYLNLFAEALKGLNSLAEARNKVCNDSQANGLIEAGIKELVTGINELDIFGSVTGGSGPDEVLIKKVIQELMVGKNGFMDDFKNDLTDDTVYLAKYNQIVAESEKKFSNQPFKDRLDKIEQILLSNQSFKSAIEKRYELQGQTVKADMLIKSEIQKQKGLLPPDKGGVTNDVANAIQKLPVFKDSFRSLQLNKINYTKTVVDASNDSDKMQDLSNDTYNKVKIDFKNTVKVFSDLTADEMVKTYQKVGINYKKDVLEIIKLKIKDITKVAQKIINKVEEKVGSKKTGYKTNLDAKSK